MQYHTELIRRLQAQNDHLRHRIEQLEILINARMVVKDTPTPYRRQIAQSNKTKVTSPFFRAMYAF